MGSAGDSQDAGEACSMTKSGTTWSCRTLEYEAVRNGRELIFLV